MPWAARSSSLRSAAPGWWSAPTTVTFLIWNTGGRGTRNVRGAQRDGQDQQAHHPAPELDQAPGLAGRRRAGGAAAGGGGRWPPSAACLPSIWTSASSSMPKARAPGGGPRPSARSRRPSWPRPLFSTKFACFSEKRAPPTCEPAAARGVEELARGPSLAPWVVGVLEGRPEGLDPGGLGLLAARAHVGQGRLHGVGVCRLRPKRRATRPRPPRDSSAGRRSPAWPGCAASCRPPWSRRPTRGRVRARRRMRWRSCAPRRRPCRGCSRRTRRPRGPKPAASAATLGRRAPPPQSSASPSRSVEARSPSSLSTRPRNPSSATRRFDPEPTTPTSSPSAAAQASSSWSSIWSFGRAK